MAEKSQSTVKFVNPHPMKIDMVKFDCTNYFGMLTISDLEDTL